MKHFSQISNLTNISNRKQGKNYKQSMTKAMLEENSSILPLELIFSLFLILSGALKFDICLELETNKKACKISLTEPNRKCTNEVD